MDYRVLTVSREFGSGGGRIAKIVAEHLGWKLLDRELIEAIACSAHVDSRVVKEFDERVESWLGRMNRRAMRSAALAAGVVPEEEHCFDADVMTQMTHGVVEQAYEAGECVIVGRGAQCILQQKRDVFHAFIYAPFHERVSRLRPRLGRGVNIDERIHDVDGERAHYLKETFGKDWSNPHLYDLMISSHEDEDETAGVILKAMIGR
ncbi:MAG: cytidylate kinase-like family protein [Terracidiphilus sp.]